MNDADPDWQLSDFIPSPHRANGKRNATRARRQCVYLIRAPASEKVKIGRAMNPLTRLSELQVGSPDNLAIECVILCDNAAQMERRLHKAFAALRSRGEWFHWGPEIRGFVGHLALAGWQRERGEVVESRYPDVFRRVSLEKSRFHHLAIRLS